MYTHIHVHTYNKTLKVVKCIVLCCIKMFIQGIKVIVSYIHGTCPL